MIHTSKPNTWDVKTEGSRTQDPELHLQSEFKISQGYRRLFQNQKNPRTQTEREAARPGVPT